MSPAELCAFTIFLDQIDVLRKEVRALVSLSHENLVAVVGFCNEPFVMIAEYCPTVCLGRSPSDVSGFVLLCDSAGLRTHFLGVLS